MKVRIRLFLEAEGQEREYFRHTREAGVKLVKDATDATKEDGIVRRVGYEISWGQDDSEN